MRTIVISALALSLAACGSGTSADGASSKNTAVGDYRIEVAQLSNAQRDAVFLRAIRDADLSCQGVIGSERLKDVGGQPTWRATCSDGVAHVIGITADGTAVVTSRIAP